MSEQIATQVPAEPEALAGVDYRGVVLRGLERCTEYNFDVETSLAATVGTEVSPAITERASKVVELTASMAKDMEIEEDFFDRPANTIMLTCIADSWLRNEELAKDANADRAKIISEREMLVDIASMLAGKKSAAVKDLAEIDLVSKDRYVEEEKDADALEADAFVESIVDKDLSDKVATILAVKDDNAFLAGQRRALGLSEASESPFIVKVLALAESVDMFTAQVQQDPGYPDWNWDWKAHTDEENDSHRQKIEAASRINDANAIETKALTDNMDEYTKRFGDKFGTLPAAFVRTKEGEHPTLYLRAPQAMALVKYFANEPMPSDKRKQDDIERIFAIIRHEFGHTQKGMTFGVHTQLGMNVEERKAEFISGDMHGYIDVKNLFTDLSLATGVSMTKDVLAEALKKEDSLSAFLAQTAQKIGMRNAMLLMALKPLPYEKYPEHAKKFADFSKQKAPSDVSAFEIPVRETLERLGHDIMDTEIDSWLRGVDKTRGLTDFHEEGWPAYRRANGMGISSAKIGEAVKKIRAEKRQALVDQL